MLLLLAIPIILIFFWLASIVVSMVINTSLEYLFGPWIYYINITTWVIITIILVILYFKIFSKKLETERFIKYLYNKK